MLENGVKTQPRLRQAQKTAGAGDVTLSQRFVWATAWSSSLTISTRSVLLQARSSGGPLGTKDPYHSLRWKGSSAQGAQADCGSELQSEGQQ